MEKRGSAKQWICVHASLPVLTASHSDGFFRNDHHRLWSLAQAIVVVATLLRTRGWARIFVVVSAVLLEIFEDEDHGGRERYRTNDCADDSDVMAVGHHSAHDQANEKDDG